jgi:ABC-type methionine transport system ATPase subunit
VTRPPLLLADEPTGNLDTRTSFEVLALLQSLVKNHDLTIVLVTHEAEIAECATRVVSVRDGRIASDRRNPKPRDAAASAAELESQVGSSLKWAAAAIPERSARVALAAQLVVVAMHAVGAVVIFEAFATAVALGLAVPFVALAAIAVLHALDTRVVTADRESDVAVCVAGAFHADPPRSLT